MARPLPRAPRASAVSLLALGAIACGTSDAGSAPDASRAADARVDRGALVDAPHVDARRTDARRDAFARADATDEDAHDASRLDVATVDAPAPADSGPCHATPHAPDYVRKVIVSRPFDASGNPSPDFELFELDMSGNLTEPGVHFTLGTTSQGNVVFTPDGLIGLVAEDDGTLGVFTFDETGTPQVIAASLTGSFYADGVVMDPSGARAYILDDQTANNGGGIYSVSIACDGTVADEGLLAAAELPAAILPLGSGDAVVATKELRGVPHIVDAGQSDAPTDARLSADGGVSGNDAVLTPWPSASSVLSFANPFDDDLAIVSSAALTQDGRYVLLGDNSQFSGVPNRVGVVRVGSGTIAGAGVVANVNDPEAIVASPFDDTLLVTSAFGNAIYVLAASADAGDVPFALRGPLTYTGTTPKLPGPAVMIQRGLLLGRVLVAENVAIRQEQFATMGVVTDLGPTPAGNANDLTSITGAIGVQP